MMRKFGSSLTLVTVIIVVLLSGCAVGPDYAHPKVEVPDKWQQELTSGLVEGNANLETWWQVFQDPLLEELISTALRQNLTLQTAVARIEEARAVLGIASGERYPAVSGFGDAIYGRASEAVQPQLNPGQKRNDWSLGIGTDLRWELDLWGRVTRSIESAKGGFEASLEDYRDVLVLLYSQIAQSYVQLRTLQVRIKYAQENARSQRETLKLTKARFKAQIAPELDVRQAESNLANTESVIPALRQAHTAAINHLAVLLGTYPNVLSPMLDSQAVVPHPPKEVLIGFPAELLRQRPDVRRAERALAAQTARIGLQKAELYPQFSLLGSFSFEALESVGDIFSSGSHAYGIGPSFRWNLFDGGRVRNAVKVEEARTKQLLVRYEQTVLEAVEDVENAMTAYVQEKRRREALERAVTAAERSVDLVRTLYITGLTNFQNVLDNERTLFSQQDRLAESDGLVTQNLIRIYRALGGGWSLEETFGDSK